MVKLVILVSKVYKANRVNKEFRVSLAKMVFLVKRVTLVFKDNRVNKEILASKGQKEILANLALSVQLVIQELKG